MIDKKTTSLDRFFIDHDENSASFFKHSKSWVFQLTPEDLWFCEYLIQIRHLKWLWELLTSHHLDGFQHLNLMLVMPRYHHSFRLFLVSLSFLACAISLFYFGTILVLLPRSSLFALPFFKLDSDWSVLLGCHQHLWWQHPSPTWTWKISWARSSLV